MIITDFITTCLSIFFLMLGACRGFVNSLMGPFSIIVTTYLSIIYYQHTKNMMISLIIGLFGPLFLHILLKLILKTWTTATDSDFRPNIISRLAGAILTFLWGWVFIVFSLILLTILPPWSKQLDLVGKDVSKSVSYIIAKNWEKMFFAAAKQNDLIDGNADTSTATSSLAQDPRFQKVMQDPEVQKEIDAHDFAKLMSNPKIVALTQEIMSDPATVKKLFAVYNSSQAQAQTTK